MILLCVLHTGSGQTDKRQNHTAETREKKTELNEDRIWRIKQFGNK